MKLGKSLYRGELLLLIPFIVLVPLFVFFCYNLGKYQILTEIFKETGSQFLPVLPILIVSCLLLLRYAVKK